MAGEQVVTEAKPKANAKQKERLSLIEDGAKS
jgi:hypothetical protein